LEKGEDQFREEGTPSAVRKNQPDLHPEKINVSQNMKMNWVLAEFWQTL
jgi:hypothetical protein